MAEMAEHLIPFSTKQYKSVVYGGEWRNGLFTVRRRTN